MGSANGARDERRGDGVLFARQYVWPGNDLTRIPDWVYTDRDIYEREVERIFHGRTWNYVALEAEVPNAGDFIRSYVGPTPVVVARAEDGTIHVFENRCAHRGGRISAASSAATTKEFVCPYHQWTYDLKGNLTACRSGAASPARAACPRISAREPRPAQAHVTTHRGVVFASYCDDMEPFEDYLGPEMLREFEATFDGRKLKLLGYYRHSLPGNWKIYHENLKDPYHATLLHTFLVTFGLLVAGNRSLMLTDRRAARRDGVGQVRRQGRVQRRQEGNARLQGRHDAARAALHGLHQGVRQPWSVTMPTIWPNLIVQREMNTLGVRQIVPNGPAQFIMKWTMFGFEGDDEEMTRHRLRQGNLMGPAGFLGLEDNEAMKFVQDGMQRVPNGEHLVKLDPATPRAPPTR